MVELELTDEDRAFRDELRAWLDENIDAADDMEEWHRRLVAGRWAVPGWPERWGGRDASLTQQILYNQLMGEYEGPVPRNSIALFNIGPMLMQHGTPEQQERYLPKMVTAEEIWCQGFSEPGAGSDLAALETRAEDRGEVWLVNGQKVWNTFGHEADRCLALVRTDPDAPKHRGISALIVDMHHPGVEVRPLREITGDDGFNEIFFTDVEVPKDQVVGPVDGGWKVAMSTLSFERLGTMKLGVQLRNRLDAVIDLAHEVAYDDHPLIRDRLAALAVEVELMQLLTEQALTAIQRGEDPGPALPLGKLQWSDLMQQLPELALEIQGPHAQLYRDPRQIEGDWQHHTIYSRMTTIGAGTTEVQKNILAYRVLGLPRDADSPSSPGTVAQDRPVSDEQAALRDTVRRFVREQCDTSWVRAMLDDERGTTDEVWATMAGMGLTGLLVDEEYGGTGLGFDELAVVLEELGRGVHPGPWFSSAVTGVVTIQQVATLDQEAELLPALADGSTVATLALLEPDKEWYWVQPTTKAEPADAGWRLTGTKLFVPDGASADLLLVTASTPDGELGLFAVPADQAEVESESLSTIDATRKQAEVRFDAAAATRLGTGDASEPLAQALDRVRTALVLDAVGAAHRALLIANDYAKVRVQFDRPIGSFQAVQHLLADMLRRVELARAGALDAVHAIVLGDEEGVHRAATAAMAYSCDALYRVTADAIQVLGGIGFTWEHDAHLYYKRALALQHASGGASVHRDRYAELALDRGDRRRR